MTAIDKVIDDGIAELDAAMVAAYPDLLAECARIYHAHNEPVSLDEFNLIVRSMFEEHRARYLKEVRSFIERRGATLQ